MSNNFFILWIIISIFAIIYSLSFDRVMLINTKKYCYDNNIENGIDFNECMKIIYKRSWEGEEKVKGENK